MGLRVCHGRSQQRHALRRCAGRRVAPRAPRSRPPHSHRDRRRDADKSARGQPRHAATSPAARSISAHFHGRKSVPHPVTEYDERSEAHRVEEKLTKRLKVHSFRSVVARDDLVLRGILEELRSRGACRGTSSRLAIISEQDTPYGQFFSEIVEGLLADLGDDCNDAQVRTFGYLRGLDGELPPLNIGVEYRWSTGDEATPASNGDTWLIGDVRREEAAGAARLDYLRRLMGLIRQYGVGQLDREVDGESRSGSRLVAVGVLGSDLYDKLLILQALREGIPNAVAFTTDLDARLADAGNYAFTRNLIVGSTYGFTVGSGDAAFRSSYATGLFRGVTLTLGDLLVGGVSSEHERVVWMPCPRLFEIGRTGPVDLTRGNNNCDESKLVHGGAIYVRSRPEAMARVGEGVVLFVPILGLIVVAIRMRMRLPEFQSCRRRAHGTVVTMGVGAVGVLGVLTWYWVGHEPSVFFEGVSSVPALVLGMTTVVYASSLWVIARGRRVQGHSDIAEIFRLQKPDDATAWNTEERSVVIAKWRREVVEASGGRTEGSVEELWSQYLSLGQWKARGRRNVLHVIAIGSGMVLFMWVADPPVPYLVRHIGAWFMAMEFLVALSVLWTIVYCVDMLALGRAFVGALVGGGWRLPDKRERRGLRGLEQWDDFVWQRREKMKLVAELTEAFGPVMVFPFVLLLGPLVAANTLSEGWVVTWPIVGMYGVMNLYVLGHALMFQFEAVRAKASVLEDLERCRREVGESGRTEQGVGAVIEEVGRIQRGAFVPWTRHPVVQSLGASAIAVGTMLAALF